MSEWIDINDDVPNNELEYDHLDYIVACNCGAVCVASWDISRSRFMNCVDGEWFEENVTHWMPLPEPPNK